MRGTEELTAWAQELVDKHTPIPWKANAQGSHFGQAVTVFAWREEDGRVVEEAPLVSFPISDLSDDEIEGRLCEILKNL